MGRLCKVLIAATVFAGAALASSAFAQSPRQIKFIVPFPAGGGADLLTRVLAEKWGQAHAVSTLIENRPGAASVIGTEAASRATPDGNTVAIVANSFIIHPNFKKLSYDPLTSFEPVCLLANSPQVIVVNTSSPYKTLTELLDAARAKPGALSHASVGPASAQHIAMEQLKLLAKVNMVFVPFNGNTPALNQLLGGHIGAVMSNYSEAVEQVNAGKLRALATVGKTRTEAWPNVPTVAEQGLSELCGRSLVRAPCARQDAKGQDRRAVEMVLGGDAGAGAQIEMGLAGPHAGRQLV
jgi:tripartite-type tricarboxylate transporter receptor subunit TctC